MQHNVNTLDLINIIRISMIYKKKKRGEGGRGSFMLYFDQFFVFHRKYWIAYIEGTWRNIGYSGFTGVWPPPRPPFIHSLSNEDAVLTCKNVTYWYIEV